MHDTQPAYLTASYHSFYHIKLFFSKFYKADRFARAQNESFRSILLY